MNNAYLILKVVHILSAITALGANLTYGFLLSRAEKEKTHLLFMLKTIQWIDRRVANPCYFVVLLTGAVMVWQGGYSFSLLWIWLPLSLFGLIGIVGIGLFSPILKRQVQLVANGEADSVEYAKVKRKSNSLGIVVTLMVISIVVLMVIKPQ